MRLSRLSLIMLAGLFALPLTICAQTLDQLKNEVAEQKYQRAIITGQAILDKNPDHTQALFLTALAHQRTNQLDHAASLYQTLIRKDPKQPEPRNNLAIIYLKQGRHDQAIDQLIDSLNTHPAYATAWMNLSNLYKGLASEAYRRALSEENDTQPFVNEIQLVALERIDSPESTQPLDLVKPAQIPSITTAVVIPAKAEPPVVQSSRDQATDFEQVVRDWANHWSSKNFDEYVAAYDSGYKGDKASHEAWIDYRRSRVLKPGPVRIDINAVKIRQFTAKTATVDFDQSYKSSNYQDSVRKRINLVKTADGWKIMRERTLAVL